ncbi:hypothetical protein ACH4GZ_23730 [Streptomyces hygroscopicus]|uniref:hypothetical protein n=1 Tax=Streptomyces hygroscopicus TaxID=1912 RepID=UPI0037A3D348
MPEDAAARSRPSEKWAVADRPKNTNPDPAVFGVAGAVLDLLEAAGDTAAKETAQALGERLRAVRREAYALVVEVPAGERLGAGSR